MTDREIAEQKILNGPDSPGKRFLLERARKRQQEELAEIEKRSRKQFESLKDVKAITTDGQPLQATPDWFDQESEELKKEELPKWAQPVEGAGPEDEY